MSILLLLVFPSAIRELVFCLGVAVASAVRCCCFSFSFVNCSCCLLYSSVLSALAPFVSAPLFPHAAVPGTPSCLLPHFFLFCSCYFSFSSFSWFSACCGFVCSRQSFYAFASCGVSGCFLLFCCGSFSSFLHFLRRRFFRFLFCPSLRFCSFSCPVLRRIRRFSSLCVLRQLALSLSPPLCASSRFSSLRLRFLLCCYTWLSLGVSPAFCCLFLVRISGSLWDESGFAEVSLFFSLLMVASCFGIPFFGPYFRSFPPSRLRFH